MICDKKGNLALMNQSLFYSNMFVIINRINIYYTFCAKKIYLKSVFFVLKYVSFKNKLSQDLFFTFYKINDFKF